MSRLVVSNVSALSSCVANGNRPCVTSPAPSLKFRTASFPQYGFKAGISDEAFPRQPSHAVCLALRALRGGTVPPFRAGAIRSVRHHRASNFHRSTPGVLARVRVMLSRSVIT